MTTHKTCKIHHIVPNNSNTINKVLLLFLKFRRDKIHPTIFILKMQEENISSSRLNKKIHTFNKSKSDIRLKQKKFACFIKLKWQL